VTEPSPTDIANHAYRAAVAANDQAEFEAALKTAIIQLNLDWRQKNKDGIRAGDVFGKWLVLGVGSVARKKYPCREIMAICRCECGLTKPVPAGRLMSGGSTQCFKCNKPRPNYKHGGKKSRLYRIWAGMQRRCRPSDRIDSKEYFDRGVRVCEEWSDFSKFRVWALENGYQDDLTIDRWPDKTGNYEPTNCRWATNGEQQRNKTTNRVIAAFGENKTIVEWSEDQRCNVKAGTLYSRLEDGWEPESAIATPPLPGGNQYSGRKKRYLSGAA
jgi:hypothetical protein